MREAADERQKFPKGDRKSCVAQLAIFLSVSPRCFPDGLPIGQSLGGFP